MNRPQSIPANYIETEPGVWVHPSRLPHTALKDAIGACEIHKQAANLRVAQVVPKPPKRIRQSAKPLLNKLEQEYFDQLCTHHRPLFAQSITFRLANGVRYTPDIFCFAWPWKDEETAVAWEVKGPWMTDDAVVKIKVFAAAYPQIKVLMASKDKETGLWYNQEVWG